MHPLSKGMALIAVGVVVGVLGMASLTRWTPPAQAAPVMADVADPHAHHHDPPPAADTSATSSSWLGRLFEVYVPRQQCMYYQQDVIWTNAISDALIGASYFSIPVALVYFVRRRRDLAFHWVFYLFALFIIACGTTHFFSVLAIWHPLYRLDGIVKAVTALASLATAFLLWPLIPHALALPSPAQLRATNVELQAQVGQRQRAEAEVRLANAELGRSNTELQQFAYVASHDLQEPLRAVAGCVQLLQQRYHGKLDQRSDELINHAVEGATRMRTLIEDLLEYSRVSTRGHVFQPTDLGAALQTALHNLQVSVQEKQAIITSDAMPTLAADPVQMTQLFQNLVGNALKYSGERRPEVHVGVQRTAEGWQFSIRDNGIGIEPQYYERIFGIFQRLHTRREYAGTGIGLAVCKRIVERHGGRIWVESAHGQGSTFHFLIPERSET